MQMWLVLHLQCRGSEEFESDRFWFGEGGRGVRGGSGAPCVQTETIQTKGLHRQTETDQHPKCIARTPPPDPQQLKHPAAVSRMAKQWMSQTPWPAMHAPTSLAKLHTLPSGQVVHDSTGQTCCMPKAIERFQCGLQAWHVSSVNAALPSLQCMARVDCFEHWISSHVKQNRIVSQLFA